MRNGADAAERLTGGFQFWRKGFWRVGLSNVVASSLALVLALDHIYMAHHLPEPKHFFTDSHGNLVEGVPLNRPVMSDADLMDFAVRSVLRVFNFNYVHYRETLSRRNMPAFTDAGYAGLMAGVEAARTLKEVEAAAMAVTAIRDGGPAIRKWNTAGDHLSWAVQFPIIVTYANTNGFEKVDLVVTATVVRVPTALYPKGIAIDSFVAERPR